MNREGAKLEFFLKSVGYPERIPAGSVSFTMRVDGMEVLAEESAGQIVLSYALTDEEPLITSLATYAAGRILKEDAALAYGRRASAGGEGPCAFIWQAVPDDVGGHGFVRLFETFMDSCDWWRARVDALRGGASDGPSVPATMMIRP